MMMMMMRLSVLDVVVARANANAGRAWYTGVLSPPLLLRSRLSRHYSPLPRAAAVSRRKTSFLDNNYNNNNKSNGVVYGGLPAILTEPLVVLERQIEIMNVAFGFEQRNNYRVFTPEGAPLGTMIERDAGFLGTVLRQVYRLHRPFHVDVFDEGGELVLTVKRSFSLINSHIKVLYAGEVVGESVQRWHLWRRRYDLFVKNDAGDFVQFGEIDSPFLAFAFPVRDEDGTVLASIDRNWVGLAREMFTDSGVYVVRMGSEKRSWQQRAVLLANAISVDFDYFSRHSGNTAGGYE